MEHVKDISKISAQDVMKMKKHLGVRFGLVVWTTNMDHVLTVNSIQIQMIAKCLTTSYQRSSGSFFNLTEQHAFNRFEKSESRVMLTTWPKVGSNPSRDETTCLTNQMKQTLRIRAVYRKGRVGSQFNC